MGVCGIGSVVGHGRPIAKLILTKRAYQSIQQEILKNTIKLRFKKMLQSSAFKPIQTAFHKKTRASHIQTSAILGHLSPLHFLSFQRVLYGKSSYLPPYTPSNNFIFPNTMQKMSIVSAELIRNHLANTSPTKIAHVFSKSKRFLSPNPECRQAFYGQSKSQLSKKKTVIGSGKRYDFTKTPTETPASSTYKMRSEFSRMNRTFTFGVSRDQSPQRSYLYRFMKTVIPGPGSYENQVKTRSSISYTHRAKTIDVVAKHLTFLETPSPNQYNSVDLNPKNGKFRVSKFADAKYSVINKSKRFTEYKEKTPAPNAYKTIDDLNDKGKFVLSQRRGKGTRPFDREMKFTVGYWKTNENPGPSDYEKPSEFGVYGDSQYYKTLRQTG